MKNLFLIICLMISALFGSVGGVVASELPNCIKSSNFWHNCIGTKSSKDGKYVGEFTNNKRHGQGAFTAFLMIAAFEVIPAFMALNTADITAASSSNFCVTSAFNLSWSIF